MFGSKRLCRGGEKFVKDHFQSLYGIQKYAKRCAENEDARAEWIGDALQELLGKEGKHDASTFSTSIK
jgi:hypothetical protein